jgi:RecG-like helicase
MTPNTTTQCLLNKPSIDFKELENLFAQDQAGYIQILITLRREIKDLVAATLFSDQKNETIIEFLAHHSSILLLMNLHTLSDILLLLNLAYKNGSEKKDIEELYSQLYYQVYHVIEELKYETYRKTKRFNP